MTYTNRNAHWYMLIYTTVGKYGSVVAQTMDVLEENYAGAEALAISVMEPNQRIESLHYMGTAEDYDIYSEYLERINEAKSKHCVVKSAVFGSPQQGMEPHPNDIPFNDDDQIELT